MRPRTEDRFFNGAIRICQERTGYRFSIDAVIAASGVTPKTGETVLDLGTGCGIIPLILAHRCPGIHIVGVEIQTELVDLAVHNRDQNGFEHQIEVIHADMRLLRPDQLKGPADWVVCNPPYRRPRSGRVNPDRQKALARHEININLTQLVQAAKRMLCTGGRFVTIFPAERLVELLCEMHASRIEPKWLQFIYSRAGENAKLVLVRGAKGGRSGLKIEKPLVIYNSDGAYSLQIEGMMQP